MKPLEIGTEININKETIRIVGINPLLYVCLCEIYKNNKFIKYKNIPIYQMVEILRKEN